MYGIRGRTTFEEWLEQKKFRFVPKISRITLLLLLVQTKLCTDIEYIEVKMVSTESCRKGKEKRR